MTTEKLPEWPTKNWGTYETQYEMARAALARMEALAEVVERWDRHMRHRVQEDELDAVRALLAACERGKEAGR